MMQTEPGRSEIAFMGNLMVFDKSLAVASSEGLHDDHISRSDDSTLGA